MLPCIFVACNNTNKNTLSTPSGLVVNSGGKIVFERVKNEEYYVINVDDFSIKVFPKTNDNVELYSVNNKNYLEYDASKVFTLGESYSIKVRACGEKKKDSEYSSPVSYTHTMPIDKPTNVQINNLTLTWDVVENASYYRVKVVTPTNNVLTDDSETIASLDLPEYQFSINKFDFASILTTVGEYKFYINAYGMNSNYLASGYTTKIVYTHKKTLETPSNVAVYKINEYDATKEQYVDNLHMTAVIDSFANAVTINADNSSIRVELNGTNSAISLDNNILDVNLNLLFNNNYNELTTYKFSIQANYVSNQKYYDDSNYSLDVYHTNFATISAPNISVEYNSQIGSNIAVWSVASEYQDFIAGYKIYIHKSTGVECETVGADTLSRILTDDDLSITVQAIGKGNYLSSALSETVSRFSESLDTSINFRISNSTISWTSVANSYIIEIDDQVVVVTEPQIDITTLDLSLGQKTLKVIISIDGYIPIIKSYDFNYSITLATPNKIYFDGTNPYLLKFDKVNNAIGYYVYLNDEKIEKLFTNTSINLSEYIIKAGEYANYTVRVQAVADKYSGYNDSSLSAGVTIAHYKVLDMPEFKKDSMDNNAPIEKKINGGATKYYLYFYGVSDAETYEIMINFNKITILNDNRSELYEVDITDYLSTANSYTITIRALPNELSNIKPSEKNSYEYELRLQLNQVTNIKVVENEGIYTLSFDLQDNAKNYSVRIIKVNDNEYKDYLSELGLSNIFPTVSAINITEYLKQAGLYQIYVTAKADTTGG